MDTQTLAKRFGFKLTALREDILHVFMRTDKPMKAYDVLDELRKKRSNAEPATVYRVLEFFINHGVLHRLDSCNAYMLCDLSSDSCCDSKHLVMLCGSCHEAFEIADPVMEALVDKLADEHHFNLHAKAIELKGTCSGCQSA